MWLIQISKFPCQILSLQASLNLFSLLTGPLYNFPDPSARAGSLYLLCYLPVRWVALEGSSWKELRAAARVWATLASLKDEAPTPEVEQALVG